MFDNLNSDDVDVKAGAYATVFNKNVMGGFNLSRHGLNLKLPGRER